MLHKLSRLLHRVLRVPSQWYSILFKKFCREFFTFLMQIQCRSSWQRVQIHLLCPGGQCWNKELQTGPCPAHQGSGLMQPRSCRAAGTLLVLLCPDGNKQILPRASPWLISDIDIQVESIINSTKFCYYSAFPSCMLWFFCVCFFFRVPQHTEVHSKCCRRIHKLSVNKLKHYSNKIFMVLTPCLLFSSHIRLQLY